MNNNITYFGKTNSRGQEVEFGIKDEDRLKHIYVIGKTGMGKSTLLENMAVQDIKKGNGLAFFDPHGSAIETFLDYIPENRIKDVIYFAPFDVNFPIAFNPLENIDPAKRYLVAQGLMAAFKKIFGEETFSDRMQHMINNTLLALLEYPGATLLHITRMLSDDAFREDVIEYITDPSVKAYWVNEYNMWDEKFRREASAAVLNKIGQFTTNPLIRNIIGQEKSSFDFREVIDDKKIFLVNLSKGQIGEDNANLLGAMLTTKLYLAAMSRADRNKAEIKALPSFYLYIDEFQNLANDSFANILSEARKYKLSLILAHQYMEQMPDTIRAAVFGNIGTMVAFQVGAIDAEILEQQYLPVFTAEDFVNLGVYEIYVRLAIDGITSAPFSASTLPPILKPEITFVDEVVESSRKHFAMPREEAEQKIISWIERKYISKIDTKKLEEKLDWEREKWKKYGPQGKYEANKEILEEARKILGFTSFEEEEKNKKTGEKIKEKVSETVKNIGEKVDKSYEAFLKKKNEKVESSDEDPMEILETETQFYRVNKEEEKLEEGTENIDLSKYLDQDELFILEAQKKAGFLPEDHIPEKVKNILGEEKKDPIEISNTKTQFHGVNKEEEKVVEKKKNKEKKETREKQKQDKKTGDKKKEKKREEKKEKKRKEVKENKTENPFKKAFQEIELSDDDKNDLKNFLKNIKKEK